MVSGGWTPLVSLPPKRTFLRPKNSQKRPKLSDYSQVKFQFELHTCPFVYNRKYAYQALKPIKYYFVAMKIGLPLEAVYLFFPRTLYLGYPLLDSNGCDFITPAGPSCARSLNYGNFIWRPIARHRRSRHSLLYIVQVCRHYCIPGLLLLHRPVSVGFHAH